MGEGKAVELEGTYCPFLGEQRACTSSCEAGRPGCLVGTSFSFFGSWE